MAKTIGIIGGMGPMATVDLYQKIVLQTEAQRDQDHIHIIIDSNPLTPDRTEFIVSNGENPEPYLVRSALRLEFYGADVLIMPCNTAHYFVNSILKHVRIPFLSMIDETAKEIQRKTPHIKTAGLLATSGTCQANIYDQVFDQYGIQIVKPDPEHQALVMGMTQHIKSGGSLAFDPADISRVLSHLKGLGAETFILGCTEIPIAFKKFNIREDTIDPTEILAASAIRFVGKKVKNLHGSNQLST